ncbi:MAG TPA: DNA topoisomerase [Phycisphaerae bacterium]|nr:DNA topoisomerase [Phycisphaerae bacterium]
MAKKSSTAAKKAKTAPDGGGRSLVIVESPAKAKTINKYLGNRYVVKACKGHVRDLPAHRYGIDPGRNFEPSYEILPSHQKTVNELRQLADDSDTVYLATDLDREGEAIAWHLATALELPPKKIQRVIFNEITKSAITEAFNHPHSIDMDKVNAQQARRILDRVVGYELSPLLWKKIAKGLSAGRVQSVAMRLIVEREKAIREFQPEEFWALNPVFTGDPAKASTLEKEWAALSEKSGGSDGASVEEKTNWLGQRGCFRAELVELPEGTTFRPTGQVEKKKDGKFTFQSAVDAATKAAELLGCRVKEAKREARKEYPQYHQETITLSGAIDHTRAPKFVIKGLETKRRTTKPYGPFTTAALQQAAANQIRFSTTKTMKTAQALYEGVDLKDGQGPVGLITYMRTDSTNLSADSIHAVRQYIETSYGPKYLPDNPNRYGSAAGAQEAHEAIRPTDVTRTPEWMRGHLNDDQLKLYTLIWKRFVACQMAPAEWDTTSVQITAPTAQGTAVMKASGRVLVFEGFYKVMGVPEGDPILPALKEGQTVAPLELTPAQKYTSPPPRFSEASLVKELEAQGIGRPSTYASIIDTIQSRGYVEQLDRRFHPTARGEIVTTKLIEHFPKVMDVQFTNFMEGELDKIEEAHLDWVHVLHEFYDPFKEALARAHEDMDAVRAEPSEYTCDQCGKPMVYRLGKNGRFLSCTGYPECMNTKNVDREGKMIEPVIGAEPCELCGKQMTMRMSKRGPFLGCTGYPDCTNTKPCDERGVALKKVKAEDVHQECPECKAPMGVKFARGRSFLGCSRYPECKATAPMPEGVYVEKPKPEQAGARCDKCGRAMVIRKSRRGPFLSCSGFPRCRNAMPMEKLEHLREREAAGEIPDAPVEVAGANGRAKSGKVRGKVKRLSKEEIAALGSPPSGFAWTLTGRPVVEKWPKDALKCFSCSGEMTLRNGRFGPFYSCAKCKAVANLRGDAKKKAEEVMPSEPKVKPIETDVKCPECNSKMLLRMGRTGRFLACSAYPKCKKTMEAPPGLLREVGAELAGV